MEYYTKATSTTTSDAVEIPPSDEPKNTEPVTEMPIVDATREPPITYSSFPNWQILNQLFS